jgi:membrane protein DedA with SNARE-associated domain
VEWWNELRVASDAFLQQHGLLAAFIYLLVEEAGVPVPVPGDLLMLILGAQAFEGKVKLWHAVVVLEAATVLGATFLYFVACWAGRGLVYRYGRYIRLTPKRLETAERWLRRYGSIAVVAGRLFPGLRIVTAVACGVLGMPAWRFLPAMAFGALIYITAYTLTGYYFGPAVLGFFAGLDLSLSVVLSLVLLVGALVWIVRTRVALQAGLLGDAPTEHGGALLPLRRRLRSGALAGALATLVSTLFMNVLTHFTGALAFQVPNTIVERTAERLPVALALEGGPWLLAFAVPAFALVGVAWGAVYGGWADPWLRLPDWASGLLFACLPLATSLLVVMSVLGRGGAASDARIVSAAGEAVRYAVYGVVVGLTYPELVARQWSRLQRRQNKQRGRKAPTGPGAPPVPESSPRLPSSSGSRGTATRSTPRRLSANR